MLTIDESLRILGISSSDIGVVEVKKAYRVLIRKWHPDKFQLPDEIREATKQAKKINIA